jgi:hypothetical protein
MKAFTTTHLSTRAFGAHIRAMLLLFLLPLSISAVFGQKIAVIGIDHSSPSVGGGDYDGISFVATENLVLFSILPMVFMMRRIPDSGHYLLGMMVLNLLPNIPYLLVALPKAWSFIFKKRTRPAIH